MTGQSINDTIRGDVYRICQREREPDGKEPFY